MGLTISNTNTMTLLNILNRTSRNQNDVLTRLATGLRINKGSDDPAGLLAVRSLDSSLTGVNAAIAGNTRTNAIMDVTDGALSEVADLIKEVQSLAQASANSAGLTPDEIAANQSQIDNAIESIDRIVRTTEFNGKKLLDGTQSIRTSGVDSSELTDVRVHSRNTQSDSVALDVDVTTAASKAQVTGYATTSAASATSISVQGRLGSVVIDIAAGDNLSAVASKINAATGQTGVTASANGSNNNLSLLSSEYGSSSFVRVSTLSGDSTNYTNQSEDGSDAVVTVNGQSATVNGLKVNFSTNGLNVTFNLTASLNTSAGSSTFTVTTGGATFQLGTDSSTRATIGIDGLFTQQLGSATDGYLNSLKSGGANSLLNNPNQASVIASVASGEVSKVQGRLGGFAKYQVQTALHSLNANKKGLEDARSVIADIDYAVETADLNKQNVLLQSAISLLGVANQQTSQILSLLR